MKGKNFDIVFVFAVLLTVVLGCGGIKELDDLVKGPKSGGAGGSNGSQSTGSSDHLLVQRVRILDEMGFDQPVEAASILLPEGWKMSGGVRWKGVNECRAEIIQQEIVATSPDGDIEFHFYPNRSFTYSDDPQLRELLEVGARSGGCKVGEPFDASQYIQRFAQDIGANVSNVRTDEARERQFRELSEKVSNGNYGGTQINSQTTFVNGDMRFDDGRAGAASIGVTVMTNTQQNYFSGGTTRSVSTNVFYATVVKFPPARKKEALETAALIITSSRTNPVWQKAKDNFLTKLGNIEHAGRMERIRLVGEQSKAYARQRDQAMDDQMRSWERQQESQDASHRQFVRTIREVDTWKDSSGDNVDLNSGYKYGWSKPDGSYILTDDPNFDPSIKYGSSSWEKMRKVEN